MNGCIEGSVSVVYECVRVCAVWVGGCGCGSTVPCHRCRFVSSVVMDEQAVVALALQYFLITQFMLPVLRQHVHSLAYVR